MAEYTQEQKVARLSGLVQAAHDALQAAEDFARENELTFVFSPAYGMGGTYYGYEREKRSWDYHETPGWVSSSSTC